MHLPRFRHHCGFCDGFHSGLCSTHGRAKRAVPARASDAPVEHPYYGGVYTGPAKVRVLPPGVSGEDEFGRPKAVTAWLRRAGHRGAASKRRARG